jgi:hypothetical protein
MVLELQYFRRFSVAKWVFGDPCFGEIKNDSDRCEDAFNPLLGTISEFRDIPPRSSDFRKTSLPPQLIFASTRSAEAHLIVTFR